MKMIKQFDWIDFEHEMNSLNDQDLVIQYNLYNNYGNQEFVDTIREIMDNRGIDTFRE